MFMSYDVYFANWKRTKICVLLIKTVSFSNVHICPHIRRSINRLVTILGYIPPILEKEQKKYVGYEYKEIVADSSIVSLLLDGYESFGWEVNDSLPDSSIGGKHRWHQLIPSSLV